MYENQELPNDGDDFKQTTKSSELCLKGVDSLIAISAMSLGVPVRALRIFREDEPDFTFVLKTFPKSFKSIREKQMIEDEFLAWGITDDDINAGLEIEKGFELDNVVWCVGLHGTSLVPTKPATKAVLEKIFYSPDGYFGNEASIATFYTQVALLLRIPPAAKRVFSGTKKKKFVF